MTTWEESVRNAPVRANLNVVLEALKNMERPLEIESDEQLVERLTHLLEDVTPRIRGSLPRSLW